MQFKVKVKTKNQIRKKTEKNDNFHRKIHNSLIFSYKKLNVALYS